MIYLLYTNTRLGRLWSIGHKTLQEERCFMNCRPCLISTRSLGTSLSSNVGYTEGYRCIHNIPARLINECGRHIAPSICELFNVSLRVGRIPVEWKSANVTPVHKKHLKEPAENYRPISLLFKCLNHFIKPL